MSEENVFIHLFEQKWGKPKWQREATGSFAAPLSLQNTWQTQINRHCCSTSDWQCGKNKLECCRGFSFLQRVAVSGSNLSRYSNCKEEHQETKCKKTKSEIVALLQHQNILWNPGNMLKILLHHQWLAAIQITNVAHHQWLAAIQMTNVALLQHQIILKLVLELRPHGKWAAGTLKWDRHLAKMVLKSITVWHNHGS